MTIEEIRQSLEKLKDNVNDPGKVELSRVQVALREWDKPAEVAPKPEPVVVETPAVGDRRASPRDPGELEQHKAKDLGLPVMKV